MSKEFKPRSYTASFTEAEVDTLLALLGKIGDVTELNILKGVLEGVYIDLRFKHSLPTILAAAKRFGVPTEDLEELKEDFMEQVVNSKDPSKTMEAYKYMLLNPPAEGETDEQLTERLIENVGFTEKQKVKARRDIIKRRAQRERENKEQEKTEGQAEKDILGFSTKESGKDGDISDEDKAFILSKYLNKGKS